jgi:hypothetical protein
MGSKPFWFGVGVGVVGTWVFHSFVKPLPKSS